MDKINKNEYNTKINREDVIKSVENLRVILGDIQIHDDYISFGLE